MKTLLTTLCFLMLVQEICSAESLLSRRRCRRAAHACSSRRCPMAGPAVQARTDPNVAQPSSTAPLTRDLFNGRDLSGWDIIEKYDFERHGKISVENGAILLGAGAPATGIRIDGNFPRTNYEVTLEGMRIEGSDFFCGITFPVGDDYLSLILGGWGGGTTGISNLDGMSAIENATTGFHEFKQNHWYQIRLRVTSQQVAAWIDDQQIVDVQPTQHKLSIWWEQEPARPFGIASWYTSSALRNIQLRQLEPLE